MDIEQEINKHLEWIENVVSLLGKQVTDEELAEISRHDHCELGRWLESDESQLYKSFSEFDKLRESHDAFHHLAGELIAAAIADNENKAIEAEQHFIETSQKVVGYLQLLKEHAEETTSR